MTTVIDSLMMIIIKIMFWAVCLDPSQNVIGSIVWNFTITDWFAVVHSSFDFLHSVEVLNFADVSGIHDTSNMKVETCRVGHSLCTYSYIAMYIAHPHYTLRPWRWRLLIPLKRRKHCAHTTIISAHIYHDNKQTPCIIESHIFMSSSMTARTIVSYTFQSFSGPCIFITVEMLIVL
jgi:hypothetical protein